MSGFLESQLASVDRMESVEKRCSSGKTVGKG